MTADILSNPVMWCILLLAGACYFLLIREALAAGRGEAPATELSWLGASGTLIAALPLLGLLGTIGGLLEAFFALARGAGTTAGEDLAGGIGAALYTTQWGLMTAIPAWFLRQWLQYRRRRGVPA